MMHMQQQRRDTLLFLAAASALGLLIFAFAPSSRGGEAITVEGARQALREAAGVGAATAVFLGNWRRQWRRTLVALFVGVSMLCWVVVVPDWLVRPSGAVLLTLAYAFFPVLVGFHVWRWVRR